MPLAQKWIVMLLRQRLMEEQSEWLEIDDKTWQEALEYAVKQRVALLIYSYLKLYPDKVPTKIFERLKKMYRTNAMRNLLLEGELCGLGAALSQHGIICLPLKGLLLSQYLYGDPAIRPSVDLDILIREQDFTQAGEVLLARGFVPSLEDEWSRCTAYRRINHHLSFFHPGKRIYVELHDKFVQRNRSIGFNMQDFWQRAQTIRLGRVDFLTLSREDQLLFLSIHSAKDAWESLLQLYDMAVLVTCKPELDWSLVWHRTEHYHCRRRLLVSLELVRRTFTWEMSPFIQQAFAAEKGLGPIVHEAKLRLLFTKHGTYGGKPGRLYLDWNMADNLFDQIKVLGGKIFLALIKCFGRGLLAIKSFFFAAESVKTIGTLSSVTKL